MFVCPCLSVCLPISRSVALPLCTQYAVVNAALQALEFYQTFQLSHEYEDSKPNTTVVDFAEWSEARKVRHRDRETETTTDRNQQKQTADRENRE